MESIYRYDAIPTEQDQNDFNKRGNSYFSLKKLNDCEEVDFNPRNVLKIINWHFKAQLEHNGYFFNKKYTVYNLNDEIRHNPKNKDIFSIYNGFEYRFHPIDNDILLSIDHRLIIKIHATINDFLALNASKNSLKGNSVETRDDNHVRTIGRLIEINDDGTCEVNFYNGDLKEVSSDEIYLLCRPEVLRNILGEIGHSEDVILLQRRHSIFNSRRRMSEIKKIVEKLNENVFPLVIDQLEIQLGNEPLPIEELGYSDYGNTYYDGSTLKCSEKIDEPNLQFDDGSSYHQPFPTRYAPFSKIDQLSIYFYFPQGKSINVSKLSKGLKAYLKNYFHVENVDIQLHSIDEDPFDEEYTKQIQNSLKFKSDLDIGIIYLPEILKYYQNSPYYKLKVYFAAQGIPTQIITDKSFNAMNYKYNYTWFNLGTSTLAKCGGIPWVLKERMKETDIIIGTSLSAKVSNLGENIHENRYIGFANVFDEYGKWMYLCGTATPYDKYEYLNQIKDILNEIKSYYAQKNYPTPKNFMIHNSRRFSRGNQQKIYNSLKTDFGNEAQCSFITVDETHNYRCFDSNSDDGSLERGYFVYLNDKEILLSTTGESRLSGAFRMGTPKMLHIIVDQYPNKFLSLEDIAHQIMGLTKLNWSSVTPAQREPVTLKYANRLAYIAANIGLNEWNTISDKLYDKPWFI